MDIPIRPRVRINVHHGLIVKIPAAGDIDEPHIPHVVDIHETRKNVGMIGHVAQVKGRAGARAVSVGMLTGEIVDLTGLDRTEQKVDALGG